MTKGDELDKFIAMRLPDNRGRRRYPRVRVYSVCASNGRAQGWSVTVNHRMFWYEVAYFRSWTLAVRLAFDTAEYIRAKEAA